MNDSMTFLTGDQIFGNNQLDIISRYGTKCAITDFSILLGGYVSPDYYTSEGNTRKDRTGGYVYSLGTYYNDYSRGGLRPVITLFKSVL